MEVTEEFKDVFENCFAFLDGRSLVKERKSWREAMEKNEFQRPNMLKQYEMNRHSELWRASKQSEQLLEYVLFLEEKIEDLRSDHDSANEANISKQHRRESL